MKRALCLVLCLCVLALAGCGQEHTDSPGTTPSAATTEPSAQTTPDTAVTQPSEPTAPATEPTGDTAVTDPSQDTVATDPSEETMVTDPSEDATEATPSATEPSETEPASDPVWMDFTFKMDGTTYQLPCGFQYFADNGWVLDEEYRAEDLIPGLSIQLVYLEREEQYLAAQILNNSGNARTIGECAVCSVTVFYNCGIEFEMADSVTLASTQEEIRTALGEPTQIDALDGEIYGLLYGAEGDQAQEIYFDFTTSYDGIYKFEITNYDPYAVEDTETSTERPAYLDSYVAPTELGEDRTAAIFQLDGVNYQLPCPMEVFIANGWECKNADQPVKGLGKDSNFLVKDGLQLNVEVMNFDAAQHIVSNCVVTAITFNDYDLETADEGLVVLPGNVTFWQAKDTAAEFFSGFEMSKYEGSVTYSCEKYENVGFLMCQYYVKYHESPEYQLYYLSYCNEFWNYE